MGENVLFIITNKLFIFLRSDTAFSTSLVSPATPSTRTTSAWPETSSRRGRATSQWWALGRTQSIREVNQYPSCEVRFLGFATLESNFRQALYVKEGELTFRTTGVRSDVVARGRPLLLPAVPDREPAADLLPRLPPFPAERPEILLGGGGGQRSPRRHPANQAQRPLFRYIMKCRKNPWARLRESRVPGHDSRNLAHVLRFEFCLFTRNYSLFALSFRQVGPRRHLLKQRLCQAGRQVRHSGVGARDRRGADAADQIRPRHGDLLLNEQVLLLIDNMQ